MLSGFSRHHDNPASGGDGAGADRYRALTDYMDAPWVMKRIGRTNTRLVRDPVPEVLYGRPGVLRRQIANLPFQRKYRFGLLSFDERDIDVAAFNAGDRDLRRQVDLALGLFFEALWPGIPSEARPMPYVTTHTHTGRLEVNVALPRAVHVGARVLSHNPDPPTPMGAAPKYWRAFRDLLNLTFGWADPEDPGRRRGTVRPDWETKLLAEGARAGLAPMETARERAQRVIADGVAAGALRSRSDVLAALEAHLAPAGWRVLATTDKAITIGAPQAPTRDRLRLRGWYFCAGFDGQPESHDPTIITQARARRQEALMTAPARFQAAWAKRAAWNRERYSGGSWPDPDWSVATWSSLDPTAAPQLIPRRHHLLELAAPAPRKAQTLRKAHTLQKDGEPHAAIAPRPALPRPHGPDRADPETPTRSARAPAGGDRAVEPRPGTAGRGAGGAEHPPERQLDELERLARALAGPLGATALIGDAIGRIEALSNRAGGHLADARLQPVLTTDRLARLERIAERLETAHDRPDTRRSADGRPHPGAHDPSAGLATPRGQSEEDGRVRPEPAGQAGRDAGSDRQRARSHAGEPQDVPGGDVRAAGADGSLGEDDGYPRHRPAGGAGSARRVGGEDREPDAPPGRTSLIPLSLATLLYLARDIARLLRIENEARLDRIEGGVALRAPGVTLLMRDTHVRLTLWEKAGEDWRKVGPHLAGKLGVLFPVIDLRHVASPTTQGKRAPDPEVVTRSDVPVDRAADKAIVAEQAPTPSEAQAAQAAQDMADTPDALDTTPADPDHEDYGPGW